MDAALYLLIGGGIGLGATLLKIGAIVTPSKCDDKFADCLGPLVSVFSFVVTIWGSIVVFGAYSTWSYDEANKGTNDEGEHSGNGEDTSDDLVYCPYTCFMFAFVFLILEWVIRPLICCCECLFFCMSCCGNKLAGGAAAAATTEYAEAATTDAEEQAKSLVKELDAEESAKSIIKEQTETA